jgi:phosphoribosylanthranilate isomerase
VAGWNLSATPIVCCIQHLVFATKCLTSSLERCGDGGYDEYMFRVKICGITTPSDGGGAIEAGADAVGLNFYPGSRRYVDRKRAAEIIAALPANAITVGVFVNASVAQIRDMAQSLNLSYIQLHGDEPPELLGEIADLRVIRAIRLSADGWDSCRGYLERFRQLGCLPQALLVDSFCAGDYGGTGESPDWAAVRQYHELGLGLPLILAGGLTPANVSEAIAIVRPFGVDVASGVESAPGIKDRHQVTAFVAAARRALG